MATESVYVILANGDNQNRVNVAESLRRLYRELATYVKKLNLTRGSVRIRAGMDSGTQLINQLIHFLTRSC